MGDVARDGYALKTVVTSTRGMLIGLLRPVVMSWITVLPRIVDSLGRHRAQPEPNSHADRQGVDPLGDRDI